LYPADDAAIRIQIQQGGICGFFSTSNAAIRTQQQIAVILFKHKTCSHFEATSEKKTTFVLKGRSVV
jgi:hypothetical protein